ncbi:MAG: crotonase/enoyl-CoA hydratase family protein [Gammaproteobacteria bacterium]|nr:crotonase/enoyl-CoA hydratase family protein [Gammaproteobacteria bacterium]
MQTDNPQFDTLQVRHDSRGVATLTLARADKHNALNAQMISELRHAARLLGDDESVRVVVLAAAGRSFCAGGDLGWMREQARHDRTTKIAASTELARMLQDVDSLSKPVIAKVQGPAYGGGLGMLSVCDIVVAADSTKFGFTETRLGLIPATIGPYVVRRLGEGCARRVFMNARIFSAHDALDLGLVSQIVPATELDSAVEREAVQFLACAPGAVAEAKALCLYLARNPGAQQLAYTAERLAERWETEEGQEGIAAFFTQRKPRWVKD